MSDNDCDPWLTGLTYSILDSRNDSEVKEVFNSMKASRHRYSHRIRGYYWEILKQRILINKGVENGLH